MGHPTQRLTTPSALSIGGGEAGKCTVQPWGPCLWADASTDGFGVKRGIQGPLNGFLASGIVIYPVDRMNFLFPAGYFGPKPKLAMGRNAGALERNVVSGWFFETVVISEIAGTLSKTT